MKTPDFLTEHELEDLLKTALTGRYGVRDALLISLGYHHCLRLSEILELKLSDVENDRIRVQRKKDSNETTQPLNSALRSSVARREKVVAPIPRLAQDSPERSFQPPLPRTEGAYHAAAGVQHRSQRGSEG